MELVTSHTWSLLGWSIFWAALLKASYKHLVNWSLQESLGVCFIIQLMVYFILY